MNRYLLSLSLMISSLWATTACSDDVVTSQENNENTGKTAIEVSVGVADEGLGDMVTRAVITDGTDKTMTAMPKGTGVWTSFKSTYDKGLDSYDWHYQGTDKGEKYCITYGTTGEAVDSKAPIEFGSNTRYWDDAHARSSMLDVWGVAVPGKSTSDWGWKTASSSSNVTTTTWSTTENSSKVYWELNANQTEEEYAKSDLCFSNNLVDYSSASGTDNRLKFLHTATPRHFAGGNMIFYHALTQITVKVVMGEGFDESDFKFAEGTNVKLSGFYGKGTFDIKEGVFDSDIANVTFNHMAPLAPALQKEGDKEVYTLHAYVVPGTDLTDPTVNDAMKLIVNNSEYLVSMKTLYDKILAVAANQAIPATDPVTVKKSVLTDGKKLKAGVNYVFTLTIGKTKINSITAQVANWETVTSEGIDPTSTTVSVTTKTLTDKFGYADNFDLYRLPYVSTASDIDLSIKNYDWTGRYTDKATLSGPTSNVWSTNWYFESLKHFYHFRAVSPKATEASGTTITAGTSPADDYLTLTSAAVTTTPSATYSDVLWGAPFQAATGTDGKYGYSTDNGFDGTTSDHQIHYGITTTEATINLLLFHIMSDVTFNVTTTTGDDKVELKVGDKDTKVELVGYYSTGKVLMGNGKVETTGSASTSAAPTNIAIESHTDAVADPATAEKSVFHYGAVPQSLTNVKLVITTPDNNQYEVDLKNVWVPSSQITSNNLANPYKEGTGDKAGKYNIDYWYPGYKYTYNLTLKQKGISDITATILDWEEVVAAEDDIQIK